MITWQWRSDSTLGRWLCTALKNSCTSPTANSSTLPCRRATIRQSSMKSRIRSTNTAQLPPSYVPFPRVRQSLGLKIDIYLSIFGKQSLEEGGHQRREDIATAFRTILPIIHNPRRERVIDQNRPLLRWLNSLFAPSSSMIICAISIDWIKIYLSSHESTPSQRRSQNLYQSISRPNSESYPIDPMTSSLKFTLISKK
jgi:hypothetical protein